MTEITKLLEGKKIWDSVTDVQLLNILVNRDQIMTGEEALITKWIGLTKTAKKPVSKLQEQLDRITAIPEGKEEDVEEEDTNVNEEETQNTRKPSKPTEAEVGLVKTRLTIKAEANVQYDSNLLDTFCQKGEVIFGDLDELKKVMSEVAFMGFRWKDVFSKLRQRAKDAGISKDMFIYHMRFLCAIYVERGSAYLWRGLNALKNKAMRVYIQAMIKVYDIIKKRPAGGYAPDDATITRIVALFPDLVAQVMKEANKVPIAAETSPEIKYWLKFPGGASLIPKDRADSYKSWLVWYRAFGKVINAGVEPAEADVKRFGDAIHNSDVTSEQRRIIVFNWA